MNVRIIHMIGLLLAIKNKQFPFLLQYPSKIPTRTYPQTLHACSTVQDDFQQSSIRYGVLQWVVDRLGGNPSFLVTPVCSTFPQFPSTTIISSLNSAGSTSHA